MFPNTPALGRRRLASLAVLCFLVVALLLPAGAAATDSTSSDPTTGTPDSATISAMELDMVAALNADRAAAGLVAVRPDARLMAIARARSADMVANDYFSHTQPDGRNVFDILTAQRITWYNAGEIIAWNNYPLDVTTSTANRQWMDSPGHEAIIVSSDLNYVGVGLAIDPATGKKVWTADFIKGPDRTGAHSSVARSVGSGSTYRTRTARVSWSGSDVRLQVLTAGLHSFRLQRRVDGGSWTTLIWSTTLRSRTMTLWTGHRYEFRVSAVDNRGNRGAWVTTAVDLR